jgi:hypothetical protein
LRLKKGNEAAHLFVRVGDFTIIRMGAEARFEWFRWIIRRMRIVEVQPQEKGAGPVILDPA